MIERNVIVRLLREHGQGVPEEVLCLVEDAGSLDEALGAVVDAGWIWSACAAADAWFGHPGRTAEMGFADFSWASRGYPDEEA